MNSAPASGADNLVAEFGENCRDIVDVVCDVTCQAIALLPGSDLSELGRHNYGSLNFNYASYLRASESRIVLLVKTLRELNIRSGKVLDQGSLFGNFALALKRLGYETVASDSYAPLGGACDRWLDLLQSNGVTIVDIKDYSGGLPFADASFDVVLSMSVIEHIPNTPRHYLLDLARCLKLNGLMAIETPNLAYQYKREALNEGKGIFFPIEMQFESRVPFSGHHREYLACEIEWMMKRVGIAVDRTLLMDYSYRVLPVHDAKVLQDLAFRSAHPDQRELILCCGRKTQQLRDSAPPLPANAGSGMAAEEGFYKSAVVVMQKQCLESDASREALVAQCHQIQIEVNKRDEMLRQQHETRQQQEEMLRQQQNEIQAMQTLAQEFRSQIEFLTPKTLAQRAAFRALWPRSDSPH